MDYDFKDLIAREVEIEYRSRKIKFKPLNTEDAIILIQMLNEIEKLDLINKPEFYELVEKSSGIPKEIISKSSIGFRTKALEVLLNLIDIDFFIDGSLGLKNLIDNLSKLIPETK